MSPEEANLVLLKANINDLALELEQKAKSLRGDTLVSISESVYNSIQAHQLENIASRLKEMA